MKSKNIVSIVIFGEKLSWYLSINNAFMHGYGVFEK